MSTLRRSLILSLALCAALALPGAASARIARQAPEALRPTYEQAVAQLVAQGYPQGVVDHLCGLGTSPTQGFRTAGTTADDAAASYIAQQLSAAGLVNVRLEPVPVDEWEFRSASVSYGSVDLIATSFAGMQATPARGITAPVVYVGSGTRDEYDDAGDVRGKICLVDAKFAWWYPYYPWGEGSLRGAAGFITAPTPRDTYFNSPDVLATMPAEYDRSMAPAVMLTRGDADALKTALAAGPVTATVKLDASFRSMKQGGTGYNVIGEIPGSAANGQRVVWASHHDAYFRGALDDTSAVAQALTVAKAMKMSGTSPARTWTFFFTTAEETGDATAYYDWLYGAWWAITRAHPTWPGTVAGVINLEYQGSTGPLGIGYVGELGPTLQGIVQANPGLTPYGSAKWWPEASSYNDQFPFACAGIPAVTFWSADPAYDPTWYHTDYDLPELIDWSYFEKMNRIEYLFAQKLDSGVLPYDLNATANPLVAAYNNQTQSDLRNAGADPVTVARLADDVTAFKAASAAFMARRASIPPSRWAASNVSLMGIAKDINANLTAISVWEETIYPYEQTLLDTRTLQSAVWELGKVNPNPILAKSTLANVSQMWYADYFSQATFRWELPRHQVGSPQLYFAELAKPPYLYDVTGENQQIDAGMYAAAQASLQAKYEQALADLDKRLLDMCQALEKVTPKIDTVK